MSEKFEKALSELCAEWDIDKDHMMDAVVAAQLAISRTLPNHPPCREAHVGILLCALFLNNIARPSFGQAGSDRIAETFGAELFKLTD